MIHLVHVLLFFMFITYLAREIAVKVSEHLMKVW